jgi:hypothetical protein
MTGRLDGGFGLPGDGINGLVAEFRRHSDERRAAGR